MTNILNFPILSLVIFVPLVGALLIMFFFNRRQPTAIKYFAFFVTLLDFVISVPLIIYFQKGTAEMQFVENLPWIPSIGATYFLGIDGISIFLVLLTTFLSAIAVLSSFAAISDREKEYYVSLMILETGMLGVFTSLDFFLFYIFWEIVLVPMYFLSGVWGNPARRLYAAIKFFLYTLFGSVVMLLGILAIYFYHASQTGVYTFNVLELMKTSYPFSSSLFSFQNLVWLSFFLSFAIKVPMFPFHTWLPDAHTEAPTAGSVILAGVLLKMGGYGFLRFNLALFPEASRYFVPLMVILGIVAIIYGALVCLAQGDMKRLIAFSSVSHMGFVVLGMFVLNEQGLLGSLLYMINHGLSTGALFLIVGILYERRHTRLIADFGGLSKQLPVFAVFFAIAMFSSIGLPGLNGFIAEFLVVVGAFKSSMLYAILAVSGIILGAAYMLWLFQRTMFGTLDKEENRNLKDCNVREVIYMLPIVVFMFWIGLYPKPFLQIMEPSVRQLVSRYQAPVTAPAAALQPASAERPGLVKQAVTGEPMREQPSTREVGR